MTPLDLVQIDSPILVAGFSPAATPTGSIGMALFWNPAIGNYQLTAPTITVGQEAEVMVEATNTSPYTEHMRMDFNEFDPDGLVGTFTGVITTVAPGAKTQWACRFTCGKVGNYSVTIYLYGEVAT